jgi:hypothetical protein
MDYGKVGQDMQEDTKGRRQMGNQKYSYSEDFNKFVATVLLIIYHILFLVLVIVGSWFIDNLIKFLNYGHSPITGLLENYLDPIMLLSLFAISIVTIYRVNFPRDSNPRLELVTEEELVMKPQISINTDEKEHNDIYQ